MRSLAWLIGCGLLSVLALSGCGKSDTADKGNTGGKRIIILTNGNSPFWDSAAVGIRAADEKLDLDKAGLKVVFETNDGTDGGQINKLRQFGTQDDIVGIGVSVNTAGNVAIVEEMKKLRDKGIHVITLDSDVDRQMHRDSRLAFIGSDNLVGGRELGKCAKGLLPEGGEYVTFVGIPGAQNARDRVGGFAEGAGPKFKSKDNMADGTDRTRARENVRTTITNHPDLKVLVGIWSYNAPAIADVVKEKGVRDRMKVVAFDAEPIAIEQMKKGLIDAMVVQNPYEMGYQSVRFLKALVEKDDKTIKEILPNKDKPEGDIYDTGLKVVVPDEGSPLKADLFEKNIEFMKLSEFSKWLDKRGLTGS